MLPDLRDEGEIAFTGELECLGWYNEARRNSFSRIDMSQWTDAGWSPCSATGHKRIAAEFPTLIVQLSRKLCPCPYARVPRHPRHTDDGPGHYPGAA